MLTDNASAGVTAKTGVQLHSADSYFLSQNKAAQLPARVNYAGCPSKLCLGRVLLGSRSNQLDSQARLVMNHEMQVE